MNLLYTIEIPNYIRKYLAAKSIRPKYYVKGKNEPKAKKYLSARYKYVINSSDKYKREMLYDTALNEFVLANPTKAGNERWKIINGGNAQDYDRGKSMEAIKSFFTPFVQAIIKEPITQFPLLIEVDLYDYVKDDISKGQDWDIGNRLYIHNKAFMDLLIPKRTSKELGLGLIPDDNIKYVISDPRNRFIPIETGIPKLVYRIYQDISEEVKILEKYRKNV